MDRFPFHNQPLQSAGLENKWEGVIVGRNAASPHERIELQRLLAIPSINISPNHCVPEERIASLDQLKEPAGATAVPEFRVFDDYLSTQMGILSNESSSGEKRMYLFDCFQATAAGLQEMIIEAMVKRGGGAASEGCV